MSDPSPMTPTPADVDFARKALLEITPADTIGAPAGSIDEGGGTMTVYFENTMLGYRGWRWTVSIARVDGSEPTVLETELTPGDGALLSPDWVPWADRLADYKETQAGLLADGEVDVIDDEDDFDDEDVNDDDEALLHSGDLDGVDIDSLEDDDFDESAPAVDVDEADDTEDEPDDAGPEQPEVAGRRQRRGKDQHGDQAD